MYYNIHTIETMASYHKIVELNLKTVYNTNCNSLSICTLQCIVTLNVTCTIWDDSIQVVCELEYVSCSA